MGKRIIIIINEAININESTVVVVVGSTHPRKRLSQKRDKGRGRNVAWTQPLPFPGIEVTSLRVQTLRTNSMRRRHNGRRRRQNYFGRFPVFLSIFLSHFLSSFLSVYFLFFVRLEQSCIERFIACFDQLSGTEQRMKFLLFQATDYYYCYYDVVEDDFTRTDQDCKFSVFRC